MTHARDAENVDPGAIDWADCPHVERNPKIRSGAWCFEGTRLPVSALFGNLASGLNTAEFMDQFPSAKLEHVKAVLDFVTDRLDATTTAPDDTDRARQVRITVEPAPQTRTPRATPRNSEPT